MLSAQLFELTGGPKRIRILRGQYAANLSELSSRRTLESFYKVGDQSVQKRRKIGENQIVSKVHVE